MSNGFITLDRKILDWRWYRNPVVKDVFIHLLLSASFRDHSWEDRVVERGQCFITISGVSKETGLTEKQVRLALDKLEKTGSITKKSEKNRGTIVTITNYDSYQNRADRGQAENRIDTMVSSDFGEQVGQTEGKPRAEQGQTEGKPRAMTEQCKQGKQCKQGNNNVYLGHFSVFWEAYPKKVHKQEALQAFEKLDVDDSLLDTMLDAIEAQKRSVQWRDSKFIPCPDKWLNGYRWEDELEPEPECTYDIKAFDEMTFLNEIVEAV